MVTPGHTQHTHPLVLWGIEGLAAYVPELRDALPTGAILGAGPALPNVFI